jgi:non-ribosomal peptide synthetase component E (peptide arylation enzyme)
MNDLSQVGGPGVRVPGVGVHMPGVVYPPPEHLKRAVQAGYLGNQTLIEAFMETHARLPERPALIGPEGDYTHAQLDDITNRVAAAFMDLGLKPLDRVVFQVPNCNELLFGYLGCLKAGLIPICSLVSHREREIGYLANHGEARMHFVQGDDPKFDHVEFAERMQAQVPTLKHIVAARGPARGKALSLKALYEAQDPAIAKARVLAVERDPFQVALFHLSGGTTGLPKIIPRFGNEYLYNMQAVAQWQGYNETDSFYNPMPFMHNFNMVCCYGPVLLMGGAIAITPLMDPPTIVSLLTHQKPTFMVLGPAVVKLAPALKKLDFSHVRGIYATHGAQKITGLLGVPAYHMFGMTEGVIMFTHAGDPQEALHHSVGRPVCALDRVKILRPGTEDELPMGEVGEPAFQGPYTTHGYYNAADRNAEAFTSDGFYRSGDLMSCRMIEGQRFYFFEGRIKDVVDRGGEKINAGEVEEAVLTHPAIDNCAVVAVKDAALGERACACIVVREGHTAPNVAQLGKHLEAYGLAKFKWPERIEVLPVLPVTHVGKLDKVSLRQRFEATSKT